MTAKLAAVAARDESKPAPDAAAIIGALPDAVLLLDGDSIVRFANPAAELLFDASDDPASEPIRGYQPGQEGISEDRQGQHE